jgi:cytochrome c oxidase subunit 3
MDALPYTVQPREDTGLYNAKVGIWLFLASEVMLFGALFSSYILLRVGAVPGTWPHGLSIFRLARSALVLITSSITVVMAWASLKMNQFNRFKIFQAFSILLAMTFVGIRFPSIPTSSALRSDLK